MASQSTPIRKARLLYAHHPLILGGILAVSASAGAAVTGSWTSFGPGSIVASGRLRGMEITPDGSTMYVTFTKRFAVDAPSQVWTSPVASANFTALPTSGYDSSKPLWCWPALNHLGRPIFAEGTAGPIRYYDGSAWQASTIPAGESTSWNFGQSGDFARLADGSIILLARYTVLRSTDGGANFSAYSSITPYTKLPAPIAAGGDFVVWPHYLTNAPQYANYGYNFFMHQTPWGELVIGGESAGFFHSLDGGLTWEPTDPAYVQPQRDNSGVPWYPNRNYLKPTGDNLIMAGSTKDGELVFAVDFIRTSGLYRQTAGNVVVPMWNGLPPELSGPGSRFVRTRKGELYFWAGYGTTFPAGRPPNDIYAWDGTAWNTITPAFGQGPISTAILGTDGTRVFAAFGSGIRTFLSDTATQPPAVDLGAAQTITYPATATLTATPDLAGPWNYGWTARQGERVTFTNASAATTQAMFRSPGNYVVNCQATNGSVRGGNSLVVRVLPQPGAVAPTIDTHPANAILTPGGPASFAVVASPASTGPLSYQWFKDGESIAGATSSTLSFNAAVADDGAAYACLVSGPGGRILSNSGTLGRPPVIVKGPADQTVAAGQKVCFTASATGTSPMQWQWYDNGTPIAGDPGRQCTYTIASASAAEDGHQYSVKLFNLFGSVTTAAATLAVTAGNTQVVNVYYPANNGSGSYVPGTQVAISAPIVDYTGGTGFFQGWTASAGVIANPSSPSTWITLPATIVSPISVGTIYSSAPSRVLTVVNGTGTGACAPSEAVPIAALPAPAGLAFSHWTASSGVVIGDADSASTTATVNSSSGRVAAVYSGGSGMKDEWKRY